MNTFQTIFFWAGIVETLFLVILIIGAKMWDNHEKKSEKKEQNWRERYTK